MIRSVPDFRAGAVQRALRTFEHLDPRDVVDVDIQRAADRGDRLLVQIDADGGQGARVVGVVPAGDAPDVDAGAVGPEGLEGHARQELGVVLEVVDVQLRERTGIQHVDGDRHALHIFSALLGGDDDLGNLGGRSLGLGLTLGLGSGRLRGPPEGASREENGEGGRAEEGVRTAP